MNNFKYSLTLASLLHDIDIINEDEAIEVGLVAYGLIGNKRTNLKTLKAYVNNGIIELPCDLIAIEAVTYTENDNYKKFKSPFYTNGEFIKYRLCDNKLYIDNYNGNVNILYHSTSLDLPEINDKEALAIADYIAYVHKYKEAIRTNNNNLLQIALLIKKQWLKHCDDARTPEYLSQNDMDGILNSLSASDRKIYGKSYKPIK